MYPMHHETIFVLFGIKWILNNMRFFCCQVYMHFGGIFKIVTLDIFDLICLLDLILYVPSTFFQFKREGSSWVEQVLS